VKLALAERIVRQRRYCLVHQRDPNLANFTDLILCKRRFDSSPNFNGDVLRLCQTISTNGKNYSAKLI